MKNKLMSFEKIESVRPHPNADRLDIVKVAGYEAIVSRGRYSVGEGVGFVHPDACLPSDRGWATEFLPFVSSKTRRVKAKKLRDCWSFGIVVNLQSLLSDSWWMNSTICPEPGTEISDIFDVTKYDPPLPSDVNVKGPIPFSPTDEERYQTLNLDELYGTEVVVTEKIDGSSLTIYSDGEDCGYCMRNWGLKIPEQGFSNAYWEGLGRGVLLDFFHLFCQKNNLRLALRGELFGPGVQASKNNFWSNFTEKKHVRWFSALDLNTREYLTFEEFTQLIVRLNRFVCSDKFVNEILNGKITTDDQLFIPVASWKTTLTQELIIAAETSKLLTDFVSSFADETTPAFMTNTGMFEGVVINYTNKNGCRGSFKIINKVYDEGKD